MTAEDLTPAIRIAEAAVFAASQPVTKRVLADLLPDETDIEAVMAALAGIYEERGVNLVLVGGGWQFRTAPDLSTLLKKVIEVPRRLPRVAMESLAIIAYHQPCTRTEVEEIRGASLSQNTLDVLLANGLIMPKGRRETPGRPALWGTTPAFLAHFGLNDLKEMPKREELLIDANGPVRADISPSEGVESSASEDADISPYEGEDILLSEGEANAE